MDLVPRFQFYNHADTVMNCLQVKIRVVIGNTLSTTNMRNKTGLPIAPCRDTRDLFSGNLNAKLAYN